MKDNHADLVSQVENHKNEIRNNIRIGCFTSTSPNELEMWSNPYFRDDHKGFCMEYKVSEEMFFPDPMVFLKINYCDEKFDFTDVMMNLNRYCHSNHESYLYKVVCNGQKFTLFKPVSYQNENEWRVIVTKNRWKSYFDINHSDKKDFRKSIKAIYLGAESIEEPGYMEYKKYAEESCRENDIALYQMKYTEHGLAKEELI